MTTVEQIRAEIERFKAGVLRATDNFVAERHVTQAEADQFLAAAGIERPEAPEVTAAREELAALKASVRTAVEATVSDSYSRQVALNAMGL